MLHRVATLLERPLHVAHPLETLDAIVVLGAPLARGGTLRSALRERVAAAAELYRAGAAPLVVATGGLTHGAPRAEAEAIGEALVATGIPDDAVLVETASLTTADNARLTAALLAPRGARRGWLVTPPFHGPRAARLFRKAGLEPRVWHIADSVQYRDRARAVRWLAREYAAWGKLLLLG